MKPHLYLVQGKLFVAVSCCAVLVGLTGCRPQTLFECKMEAAKAPTENGARIAAMACEKEFGFDPSTATPAK